MLLRMTEIALDGKALTGRDHPRVLEGGCKGYTGSRELFRTHKETRIPMPQQGEGIALFKVSTILFEFLLTPTQHFEASSSYSVPSKYIFLCKQI